MMRGLGFSTILLVVLSVATLLLATPTPATAQDPPWEAELGELFTQLSRWQRDEARVILAELVATYREQGILQDKWFRSLTAYLTAMTRYCEPQYSPEGNLFYITHYRFPEAFEALDGARTGELDDTILLGWKAYLSWYGDAPTASIRQTAAECVALADAWIAREPANPEAHLWAGACRTWLDPLWTTETNAYLEFARTNGANPRFTTMHRGLMFAVAENWDAAVEGMYMPDYVEAFYLYGLIQSRRGRKDQMCWAMDIVNFQAPEFWEHQAVARLRGSCRSPNTRLWTCEPEPAPCIASCSDKLCGEPDGCGGVCSLGSGCHLNRPAKGLFGGITANGDAEGWACDPDQPEQAAEVELYGTLEWFGRAPADRPSSASINVACNGGTGHRFRFRLPATAKGELVFARVADLNDGQLHALTDSPQRWSIAPATLRFPPIDDAYVDVTAPHQSFGVDSHLEIQSAETGRQKHGYLRFNVTGIPPGARVQSATLRLRSKWWPISALSVFQIQDWPWNEQSLNYENASLAANWEHLGTPVPAGAWVEIDVSPTVRANGLVTYGISHANDVLRLIWSKESPFSPELVVVTQ